MSEEQTKERFDEWAVIDLFGHSKIAGRVTEQTIGGQSFVRVDVPEINGAPGFTKFFGAGAIYSMSPTTEAVVRRALSYLRPEPISVYIPPERTLPNAEEAREPEGEPHDCSECGNGCNCGMNRDLCHSCSDCRVAEG